jgi:hypothetical protein
MTVPSSRKKSPFRNTNDPLFFSIVDYRNNYFISDDPNQIIEFYNGFENRDQLIQWMRERPKGVSNIHEVDGDKEIIVVIPTADFNRKYAKECRENIFKGLHMVFVESGEIPDPYFNYAHNCNVGIRKAMTYNPVWIIVTNDDTYKIDNIIVLKNELDKINPERFSIVFTNKSAYHSIPARFSKARFTRYPILALRSKMNLRDRIRITLYRRKIERQFRCEYYVSPRTGRTHLMYKPGFNFISFTNFGIFSASYAKSLSGDLFDETFVNAHEDHDVAINLFLKNSDCVFINYKIGDYMGSSFGNGTDRQLRNIAGISYLNYKFQKYKGN